MSNEDMRYGEWITTNADLVLRFDRILLNMSNANLSTRTDMRDTFQRVQRLMAGLIEDLDKSTPRLPLIGQTEVINETE